MSGAQCGLRSGMTLQVPDDSVRWLNGPFGNPIPLLTGSDLSRATKPEELVSFWLGDPLERPSPLVP